MLCNCLFFLWLCQPYPEYRGIHELKIILQTIEQLKQLSYLFLLKGNFSGLFFFRTSRDEGEFPRGYLINTAACLFACHYNRHQVVDKNLSTLSKSQYQRKQSLLQCLTLDTLLLFAGMVGRVSTNNVQITYSDQIYKALQKKPSNIMFLTKKRRSTDAH